MNIKDFTWVEKRFGTRFANILNNFDNEVENQEINKMVVDDLEQLFVPRKTTVTSFDISEHYFNSNYFYTETDADYEEPSPGTATEEAKVATLSLDNCDYITKNDLLLVKDNYGYDPSGTQALIKVKLILIVDSVDADAGEVTCRALNGKKIGTITDCVPSIGEGSVIQILGKLSSDIKYPVEIESKIKSYITTPLELSFEEDSSKANGLINENTKLNDVEKIALKLFKYKKDNTLLFNVYSNTYNTSEGIYYSAGKEIVYNSSSVNASFLVDMCKKAFNNAYNNSNKSTDRKILLAGSELTSLIYKVNYDTIIDSPFGTIDVYYMPSFDLAGYEYSGLVLDLNDAELYVKKPLTADFKNGVMTFSEECCIVLNNSREHMRIIKA